MLARFLSCLLLLALGTGCSPRVLWVGIDSGNWATIDPLIEAGHLPVMERLVAHGVRADLDCEPAWPAFSCHCPPVWMSQFTGQPKSVHNMSLINSGPLKRVVASLWDVHRAHRGQTTLLSLHNLWPPEQDVSTDVVLTEYGAEFLAAEHAGIYEFRPSEGGSLAADRPETWTKPPFLFEALGMDQEPAECTNDNRAQAKDRLSRRMLTRLAEEKAHLEWWERPSELDVILLHAPDKNAHVSWGALEAVPNDPVMIDEAALLGQAQANTGNLCLPPPFQWGQVADDLMEIDRWLGELLEIIEYDYVVITSDHAMSRSPQPFALVSGVHNTSAAFDGMFLMYGPGLVNEGLDLGRLTVHDVAPQVAYALGLPIAEDLAGQLVPEIFTDDRMLIPPVFVETWADYYPY